MRPSVSVLWCMRMAAVVATVAATRPVALGSASEFAILTMSGVSAVPPSAIEGDVGVSPIAVGAVTGFSLAADPSSVFSTSKQITGRVYAANHAVPTPARLTTAIIDMQAAYTDAAGRAVSSAANVDVMAGQISGATFAPGVYKWGSHVVLGSDIYIQGSRTDIFIFQATGNVLVGSAARVLLVADGTGNGLPRASNVVWQIAGFLDSGTASHLEGTFLVKTKAVLKTGSSINGRILAQTACTLDSATVIAPTGEAEAIGGGRASGGEVSMMQHLTTGGKNLTALALLFECPPCFGAIHGCKPSKSCLLGDIAGTVPLLGPSGDVKN